MKSENSNKKNRKERYKEKYESAKQGGETFFPETLAKDALVALLVVLIIVILAIVVPIRSEAPADPTSTTYNPRPEWYFLFFFQFLKFFPGWLEPVAAVIVPVVALTFFLLIPFIDRGLERRFSLRKRSLGAGILAVLVFIALVLGGTLSAPAQPAGEETTLVQEGRGIYKEVNCAYCHSINGIGGNIGPDLSAISTNLNMEQINNYLTNPHAMVPNTLHPKLQFTAKELSALTAYLQTLGKVTNYSPKAVELYEKSCSSCHIVNEKGGELGPNLTGVGSRRSINFLEAYTRDPSSVIPGAKMPAFKSNLTQDQINDIAAYLYSLK